MERARPMIVGMVRREIMAYPIHSFHYGSISSLSQAFLRKILLLHLPFPDGYGNKTSLRLRQGGIPSFRSVIASYGNFFGGLIYLFASLAAFSTHTPKLSYP